MSDTTFVCDHCKRKSCKRTSAYNRALALGLKNYCGLKCSGLGRRDGKTKAQKVAEKAAYDREYRVKNAERLKAEKAALHKRTYTPEYGRKFRAMRKRQGWDHTAYCRRYYADPKKRKHKHEYDIRRGASRHFGTAKEWAECWRLYLDLKREIIRQCPIPYERMKAKGYYEREHSQQRKRREGISKW